MLPPRTWMLLATTLLLGAGSATDSERNAFPPPSPKPARPLGEVLFRDDFGDGNLEGWRPDQSGVWSVRRGLLRADLPDEKQRHSFLFGGHSRWQDYALDLDVCAMRGADKGMAVRVVESGPPGETGSGIGVDLRGPGYHDVLLHRRHWSMGRAPVVNGNGVWHHVRIEARGHRYRVWVNGAVALDRMDGRRACPRGGIALAAYTGGVGECTLYYDNVVVTALAAPDPAAARNP
jgi:hypothetical protein